MKNILSECLLEELNLSNFDTNNVTDMNGMFSKCLAWKKIDLSIFNADNFENINLFLEKGINIQIIFKKNLKGMPILYLRFIIKMKINGSYKF